MTLKASLFAACLASAQPALSDSDVPLAPSPAFAGAAEAALESCVAKHFVVTDINAPERPDPSCALVGSRQCTDVNGGDDRPLDPACSLAEYQWWVAQMDPAIADLENLFEASGLGQAGTDALRSSQSAWLGFVQAQCDYAETVRGADRYACLAYEASKRTAWLLTWAGEF